MVAGLKPLTDQLSEPLTRDDILQAHARHESAQQHWTPAMRYSDLLAIVYKRLAEEWGIDVTVDECERYGHSVPDWPAFADAAPSLEYLKQHFKLVILSNVDNRSFAASNTHLKVQFDAIYTAEDVGSYKPAARNFDYMLEKLATLEIKPSEILHTAESLFHDHVPALQQGLARCWIYRRHNQQGFGATMDPGKQPTVDYQFTSMAQMVQAHKDEIGSR